MKKTSIQQIVEQDEVKLCCNNDTVTLQNKEIGTFVEYTSTVYA